MVNINGIGGVEMPQAFATHIFPEDYHLTQCISSRIFGYKGHTWPFYSLDLLSLETYMTAHTLGKWDS